LADGELQEGLVTLSTAENGDNPPQLDTIKTTFNYRFAKRSYYKDKRMAAILSYYQQAGLNGYLLFPIGSLRCIQHLQQLSNGQLLLLTTDKGYSTYMQDYMRVPPTLVFHGSFSMMVNFDAIGRYIKSCGGDVYYQSSQQDIVSCAFLLGQHFRQLPETRQALSVYLNDYSPGNLFNVYNNIQHNKARCSLNTYLAHFALTHWDPQLLNQCIDHILQSLSESDVATTRSLLTGLRHLAANFYPIPQADDTLLNIAMILQNVKQYVEALSYYEKALKHSTKKELIYYNMGVCSYLIQQYAQAAELFSQVLHYNPTSIRARGWLVKIRKLLVNKT
jgi:tetratricopeptide (TPR) repeat protein